MKIKQISTGLLVAALSVGTVVTAFASNGENGAQAKTLAATVSATKAVSFTVIDNTGRLPEGVIKMEAVDMEDYVDADGTTISRFKLGDNMEVSYAAEALTPASVVTNEDGTVTYTFDNITVDVENGAIKATTITPAKK